VTDFGSNSDPLERMEGDGVAEMPVLLGLLTGCFSSDPDEQAPPKAPARSAPPTGLDAYQVRQPGDLSTTPGRQPISSGQGCMERGVGLKLEGEAEPTAAFKQMLAEGLLGSAGLRDVFGGLFDIGEMEGKSRPADLMSLGANRMKLGRGQPGVLGDTARTGEIDVSDIEALSSFPAGSKVDEFSREDMLAHVFAEQLDIREKRMRGEPISAEQFKKVHNDAIIDGTNETRIERGARPIDGQFGVQDDAGNVAEALFQSGTDVIDRMKVVDEDFQR